MLKVFFFMVEKIGFISQSHYEKKKKIFKCKQQEEYQLIKKSRYFNQKWYLKTYPDVKMSGMDPIQHYLKLGWKESRKPSACFDSEAYLKLNPDVKARNVNPLFHYEKFGKKENRKISLINEEINTKEYKIIKNSNLFNKRWYLKKYPDVKEAGINPIKHYLRYGWEEGRDPSVKFNTKFYLDKYKDIRIAGVNPLVHYIRNGKKEGRLAVKPQFSMRPNRIYKWFSAQVCKNITSNQRILVVLHLFYPDEWVKINEFLQTLSPYKMDLKVTVTEGYANESVLAGIKKSYSSCEIITLPNVGYDVAPFIYVLNKIDLSKYDLVYKLQSKGINVPARYIYGQVFVFKDWFLNLYRGIFGIFRTHKIVKMFESNQKLGLVAARNLITEDPVYKQEFTKEIASKYGIYLRNNYRYVIGTCFVARAKCLEPIKKLNLQLSDFEQTKRGEFSTAHAFERIVCAIIESEGYEFMGLWTLRNPHVLIRRIKEKYSSQRLLSNPLFNIDYEFFYKVLESKSIYKYEIVEVCLGEIKRIWDDGKVYNLTEVAPFKYLNDKKNGSRVYNQYCEENRKVHGFSMGVDRFKTLIESVNINGFDSKNMPVIDQDNCIMDGQHRSCILLHKYGPNHKIKVLKLWLNPIKLKKNSHRKLSDKENHNYLLIRKSRYFNKAWYLKTYPDVKDSKIDPILHYLNYGWRKGYNPSMKFNGNDYLIANYDIKKANICPLVHYEMHGAKEGRPLKLKNEEVKFPNEAKNISYEFITKLIPPP